MYNNGWIPLHKLLKKQTIKKIHVHQKEKQQQNKKNPTKTKQQKEKPPAIIES